MGSTEACILYAPRGMGRVLVLNATYEPLSVVSGRRAVVLVLDHKADTVHEAGPVLHSERISLPLPSVVRLRHYVNLPRTRRAALSRRAVFARDGHRCQYCGDRADSIDHVVPRSRGGEHIWENVVAACHPCNTAKRDRLLDQTPMRLLHPPRQPRTSAWVAATVDIVPREWHDYLGHERSTPIPA